MEQENQVDVLYMIRARIDTGRDKGAPQLRKDIRALKRAEKEIVRLRQLLESKKHTEEVEE